MQGLGTSVIGANDCWEEQVDLAEVESTADGDQIVGLQADAQGMERPT